MGRRRAAFRVIIVANAIATVVLVTDVASLLSVLSGSNSSAASALLFDVALIAVSNILIFSIWYWIIDPPGVIERHEANPPWVFLFPQRGSTLPSYESWVPGYVAYLFIAFTTSFAFSPTDTLPLTRVAKQLMLAEAVVSVGTVLLVIARSVNIFK